MLRDLTNLTHIMRELDGSAVRMPAPYHTHTTIFYLIRHIPLHIPHAYILFLTSLVTLRYLRVTASCLTLHIISGYLYKRIFTSLLLYFSFPATKITLSCLFRLISEAEYNSLSSAAPWSVANSSQYYPHRAGILGGCWKWKAVLV